jgi:hypothetical protein
MTLRSILRRGPALVAAALVGTALLVPAGAGTAETPDPDQVITLDPSSGGRLYEGMGAISGGGGTSRLLVDYPADERNEILDYLFKPQYGASLDILKVEIGGDTHSSNGAEPSHMRAPGEVDCNRGYEWWLMKEAKKRNPDISLYGLAWGAPGWFRGGYWSQDSIDYFIEWLNCAEKHHLDIDYMGGRNEREPNLDWYVDFRRALDENGYQDVQLVAADEAGTQRNVDYLKENPEFADVVDVIGTHYPCSVDRCTPNADAVATGKRIWASESGWNHYLTGAKRLGSEINHQYVDSKMTAFINWPLTFSWYPTVQYQNSGLMKANEPWSGHYDVGTSLWTVAQTAQFADPGWSYVDSGSGYLTGGAGTKGYGGTAVTLVEPSSEADEHGRDWTVVAETTAATAPQTVRFELGEGLSDARVNVRSTLLEGGTGADWFAEGASPEVVDGAFEVTLQPNRVYTFSTVDDATKGDATAPASKPMDYQGDKFEGYPFGESPTYLSDMEGAFETARCEGRGGKCLRQVITDTPLTWMRTPYPISLYGDITWKDYTVSTDVLLEEKASVAVAARITNEYNSTWRPSLNIWNGYWFWVDDAGHWRLELRPTQLRPPAQNPPVVLDSGTLSEAVGTNRWHRVSLDVDGDRVTVQLDGRTVTSVRDASIPNGQVGMAVDSYSNVQFDNFTVQPH